MCSVDGFQRAVRVFENKARIKILTPDHAVKFAKNLQEQGKYLFQVEPLNSEVIKGNATINKVLLQMAKASQDPLAQEKLQGQCKEYTSIIRESFIDKTQQLQQRYEEMQEFTEDLISRPETAVILRKAKNIQMKWIQFIKDLDQEHEKWLPFFLGKHHLVDAFLSDLLTLTYKSHEQLVELENRCALSPTLKDSSCMEVLSFDGLEEFMSG